MSAMAMQWMGYVAAVLVFGAFYMRTMLPLRWMAIVSNVAFLSYAVPLHLWPIVILHGLLLPLNVLRLRQLYRMLAGLKSALVQDIDVRQLLPSLAHRVHPAGTVLFNKGEPGDCAYYIASGEVEIPEIGVRLHAGQFFGEVGVFASGRSRTRSAVCASDAELYRVGQSDLVAAFYQNPSLALALVRLIADRLANNAEQAELALATARGTPYGVSSVP